MSQAVKRPIAIVTGANGGMGRACARLFGATMDLVVTDAAPALRSFAQELQSEGYTVAATIVGNLGASDVLDALARSTASSDGFDVLIHTCGLAPSASWRKIMDVNYVASVKLLDSLRPFVHGGTVAVMIASVAGHLVPSTSALETVLANPLSPRICDDLEPLLMELAGPAGASALGILSYALSKKKVVDLCAERASDWGGAGARIVSISPGMIFTPMGRREAEIDPLAEKMVLSTPIGRWGTPAEIALAAQFLASPAAAFITGSDLKLDGGSLVSSHLASRDAWLESIRNQLR